MFRNFLVLSCFVTIGGTAIVQKLNPLNALPAFVKTSHAKDSNEVANSTVSPLESTCYLNAELQALLDLHNKARSRGVRCGDARKRRVPKLKYSCALAKASRSHSMDMSQNTALSHTGSDGSSIAQRAVDVGYDWRQLGENIAQGFRSSQSVNTGWLNSTGHCNNIMNAGYTEMGAARVNNYWTVMFGRQ